MTEYSKRPEVTVETMGKVHNPSGAGVPAISSTAQKKFQQQQQQQQQHTNSDHDTQVKHVGSARRNITRKKSDNSYDSRNKKQGGHGKGQWSELSDDPSLHPVELDPDDPLYDEEELESGKYILSSGEAANTLVGYDAIAEKAVYGNLLTLPEFKIRTTETIQEYFDSADADEVIRSIEELKCHTFLPHVVKRAISLSLDQGPRERELVSRLLCSLHPTPLSEENIEEGFDLLLRSLDDLSIDIPDAKIMVGSFLARAVVDEVVPPAFLSQQNNDHPGSEVIDKAVSLLSREHCTARLEKVWGPGDGRPVAELKTVMDQLLKEYLLSRELDEAAACVRELNAPHFHHELVKRGVTIAMESSSSSSSVDAMVALISFLVKNAIVSEYQVAKGVSRLRKILPDLTLDVPSAPAILDEFEGLARTAGCFPPAPEAQDS